MPVMSPVQVFALIRQRGGSAAQAVLFTSIAGAESSFNSTPKPNANKNGTTDYGLFQINSSHLQPGDVLAGWSVQELSDPGRNADAAKIISNGWKNPLPWSTYKNKKYQDYNSQAMQAASEVAGNPGLLQATAPDSGLSIPNPLAPLTDTAQAGIQAVGEVSKIWETLTTPHTWVRILYVIGGTGLAMLGVNALAVAYGLPAAKRMTSFAVSTKQQAVKTAKEFAPKNGGSSA